MALVKNLQDDPENGVYLYKNGIPGAKWVSRKKDREFIESHGEGARSETEEAKLKAQGWSERRFAIMLYHKQLGQKVITDPKLVDGMLKSGWAKEPFKMAANETPMYHAQFGFKMAQSDKEVEKLQAKGWQTAPVVAAPGQIVNADSTHLPVCYHPHEIDDHRQVMLVTAKEEATQEQPAA